MDYVFLNYLTRASPAVIDRAYRQPGSLLKKACDDPHQRYHKACLHLCRRKAVGPFQRGFVPPSGPMYKYVRRPPFVRRGQSPGDRSLGLGHTAVRQNLRSVRGQFSAPGEPWSRSNPRYPPGAADAEVRAAIRAFEADENAQWEDALNRAERSDKARRDAAERAKNRSHGRAAIVYAREQAGADHRRRIDERALQILRDLAVPTPRKRRVRVPTPEPEPMYNAEFMVPINPDAWEQGKRDQEAIRRSLEQSNYQKALGSFGMTEADLELDDDDEGIVVEPPIIPVMPRRSLAVRTAAAQTAVDSMVAAERLAAAERMAGLAADNAVSMARLHARPPRRPYSRAEMQRVADNLAGRRERAYGLKAGPRRSARVAALQAYRQPVPPPPDFHRKRKFAGATPVSNKTSRVVANRKRKATRPNPFHRKRKFARLN